MQHSEYAKSGIKSSYDISWYGSRNKHCWLCQPQLFLLLSTAAAAAADRLASF